MCKSKLLRMECCAVQWPPHLPRFQTVSLTYPRGFFYESYFSKPLQSKQVRLTHISKRPRSCYMYASPIRAPMDDRNDERMDGRESVHFFEVPLQRLQSVPRLWCTIHLAPITVLMERADPAFQRNHARAYSSDLVRW